MSSIMLVDETMRVSAMSQDGKLDIPRVARLSRVASIIRSFNANAVARDKDVTHHSDTLEVVAIAEDGKAEDEEAASEKKVCLNCDVTFG